MNTYLSEAQIDQMADAALSAYEMTADSHAAMRAAQEYAVDEFGVKPRKSAVLLAYQRAMTGWEGRVLAVRHAIG